MLMLSVWTVMWRVKEYDWRRVMMGKRKRKSTRGERVENSVQKRFE